jgi:hypothetical protein
MDASAKQQVVERLKQAQNILVTVSANPSVDQLAACIGLTLLLNKTGKHTTAVFSGSVPSILEFLQPEKTIEHNTDSLRDFIISLDKEKADKLRYKVEDDVVKIFITPYRTSLSEKDLVFSQGDFNVEAVMALGVKDKSQLDAAITAHGRILHDATVISVNAGQEKGADIGQINWQDPSASSLSEMIVSVSEALGSNLIDNQMATAFLTGIVAETQRFSNPKTSPKVMTMSAQLMAAGANQQLIVSKLETVVEVQPKPAEPAPKPAEPAHEDGTLNVEHPEPAKQEQVAPKEESPPKEEEVKAELKSEDKKEELPLDKEGSGEIHIDDEGNIMPAEAERPTSMPGSHTLLTPTDGSLESPFTANTEPGQSAGAQTQAIDPFTQSSNSGILTHAPTVQPPQEPKSDIDLNQSPADSPITAEPHVDKARNAVESALAAAPFDPALNPVEALNASPLAIPDAEDKGQDDKPDAPAPPPLPPPLMPSPGVVIPPKPYNGGSNTAQKIDADTL